MKLSAIPLRQKAMLAVLVLIASTWAAGEVRVALLADGLHAIAETQKSEMLADWPTMNADDLAHEVTASIPFVIAGAPNGKITIFMRKREAEVGREFSAYDMNLRYENGAWKELDSGICYDEHCIVGARKAFGVSD